MQDEKQSMMTRSEDVCAGIVLYNPDVSRLQLSISAISKQVDAVVLVDNGSDNNVEIKKVVEVFPDISLISLQENMGIAYALNKICEYSANHHSKWAFTLDQDTICPPDIIQKLLMSADGENDGIVCPAVYYEGLDVDTRKRSKEEVEIVKACMTSASLTNLNAWREVGGFNNSYFMDYVDNDFCMKLNLHNYIIKRVNSCIIYHQLGDTRTISILGKSYKGTSHSPLRCYYMMRNNILYLKEYKSDLPLCKEIVKVLYVAYNELFFSKNKWKTFAMVNKGIRDGLRGISGKYLEKLI